MKPAFVDTSFYGALAGARDALHAKAIQLAGSFRGALVTTEYVLIETGNFFARTEDRAVFVELLPSIQVVKPRAKVTPRVSSGDHKMATVEPFVDRKRGALVGLAVGDALGAAVEFKRPGSFPKVTGYRSGGPHGLNAGEWTDDTSMALALADSIASVGWDLNDQAKRYVAWWRDGEYSVNGTCFDIGVTTRIALSHFRQTGDARTSGDSSERASGNGSIMRLAAVPIRYADLFPERLEELIRLLVESSLPTHASPQCQCACAYFGFVLAALIQGEHREDILTPDWPPLAALRKSFPLHREIDEVAAGSFRRKQPPEIVGSGYVVNSLEAALWAFYDAKDFRQAVLRAVNLGDDADTTGAVCGQLAGAFWGESGILAKWRRELARTDMIEKALHGLLSPQRPAVTPSTEPKAPKGECR